MHRPNKNPIWEDGKPFATCDKDGLSPELELSFRHLAIHLVHTGGKMLKMSPAALFTACHYVHRVYAVCSFFDKHFDILSVVMASLLLAGKVEESARRVRDVVNTFDYLYTSIIRSKKYRPFKYTEDEYYRWRDRVTDTEVLILRLFGFHVTPQHPTVLMLNYLNALKLLMSEKETCQRALNYLFDSTRTIVSIKHQPNTIACACIELAAIDCTVRLPLNWTLVFDVSEEDLVSAMTICKSIYEMPLDLDLPIDWHEQEIYVKSYRQFMHADDGNTSPALSYSSFSSSDSNK